MADDNKLTPEQMFDYIGINTDNIDDFKTQFDGKFLTRENAINDSEIKSKLTGAMAGGITTHIKRSAKENFGLEISKDEIEGKKVKIKVKTINSISDIKNKEIITITKTRY